MIKEATRTRIEQMGIGSRQFNGYGGKKRMASLTAEQRSELARTAVAARWGSKGGQEARALALMRRPQGATLGELMDLTGWKAGTVYGFVNGRLVRKLGLRAQSFLSEGKERTYRIAEMAIAPKE
jgi:hypothetical protein